VFFSGNKTNASSPNLLPPAFKSQLRGQPTEVAKPTYQKVEKNPTKGEEKMSADYAAGKVN